MKRPIRSTLALALAGACLTVHAESPLPAGISGAWFNPEQPGHGLSVEILSDDHAIVFWYTYDHDGNPLNLYLEGQIHGSEMSGTAYAPRGMRFGSFDPADRTLAEWGTLRLRFDDCNHGSLAYDANDAAFGEGELPLLRLTKIKDSTCVLGYPERLATGLYDATFRYGGAEQETRTAVDADGTLHLVSFLRDGDGVPAQPQEEVNRPVIVAQGSPLSPQDGTARIALDVRNNNGYNGGALSASSRAMTLQVDVEGSGATVASVPGVDAIALDGIAATRSLDADLSLADLAGTYHFAVVGPLPTDYRVEIAADGALCVRADVTNAPCRPGQVQPGVAGFFEFAFDDASTAGKGWLETDADGTRTVVLIGDFDHPGSSRTFGVVAETD